MRDLWISKTEILTPTSFDSSPFADFDNHFHFVNLLSILLWILISSVTAVAEYYTVHAVPQRYNPGIIIASVAVSVLGAYSTLLLLGKRTSNNGARNVALLILAAGTMAAVGIWGMVSSKNEGWLCCSWLPIARHSPNFLSSSFSLEP